MQNPSSVPSRNISSTPAVISLAGHGLFLRYGMAFFNVSSEKGSNFSISSLSFGWARVGAAGLPAAGGEPPSILILTFRHAVKSRTQSVLPNYIDIFSVRVYTIIIVGEWYSCLTIISGG